MKSPLQVAYQHARKSSVKVIGEKNVYDYAPGTKREFPLIIIGTGQELTKFNKTAAYGIIIQELMVYSNNFRNRGTLDSIATKLKEELLKEHDLNNYSLYVNNINSVYRVDDSTKTPLPYIRITIEFRYN